MSYLKSKIMIQFLKPAILLAGILAAISSGQSCSKKPSDGDSDTLKPPPWNQMSIDLTPAWSLDGTKIVYAREPADGARDTSWQWGAFIYDVNTGKDTCIWPNILFDGFAWSPDGERLAFIQSGLIYVHSFTNNSSIQITTSKKQFRVRWSPCGDKLVFFYKTLGGGLFVYDFEDDSITHVINRSEAGAGDWLPDCSTLVLLDSCVYKECGITRYQLYRDSVWIISQMPGYKRDINVSPDGQTILVSVELDIWAVNIDGGEPNQLTTEGGAYADWSPDGQWIVYTKIDRRNGYLWLMRPDGTEKHQITF